MKKSKWLCAGLVCAGLARAFGAMEIQCVADGASGEYCGTGYGITVNVSAPSSGYTVKYAAAETGPWVDELKYVDVCTAKPIWYQVSAPGYETKTGSADVTVTPKTLTSDFVWGIYPPDDYVYDGAAKEPDTACGDGEPSIITPDDFTVSYENNVNAGTAKIVFTGKNNYAGTVEEEFEIMKADNAWTTEPALADWTYGQTPSEPVSAAKSGTATVTYSTGARPTLPGSYTATFTVPASANYNALTKDVSFRILAATIACVADGASGEYCGTGYGITVNVSAPSSGYTVKYAAAETGPWVDELKYVDVCTAKPIWYQVSAPGYETKTGSADVTVTPKTLTSDFVWGIYPPDDYVYDGAAKEPDTACGDGEPSIITPDDFTVSYENNVNAGTAKIVFTGKNNYAGTVEEEFEVAKATVGGGNEPGTGTVPPGGISKWDVQVEYDGRAHTLDTNGLASAVAALGAGYVPAVDFAVQYAVGEEGVAPDAGWDVAPASFVNAGTNIVWYKVSAANFDDFAHAVRIVITPRAISHATIAPIPDQTFDGTPCEPVPVVTDGTPSIITADDYLVSYSDNAGAGTATLTLTGTNNYAGVASTTFAVVAATAPSADLAAEIAWTYLKASGTYFAQIKVTCTNGLAAGISNLRYLFADRGTDAMLWDTPARTAKSTTVVSGGETYRAVALDSAAITAENAEVVYGVRNAGGATIPVAERTIEMYVSKRVVPQTGNEGAAGVGDFVGYLSWESGGSEHAIPLVAGTSRVRGLLSALPAMRQPASPDELNLSLAVGAAVTADSSPYLTLTAFAVDEATVSGSVEVGAGRQKGSLGANASVVLLGASSLAEPFREAGTVPVDETGGFTFARPEGMSFFKVKLVAGEMVK